MRWLEVLAAAIFTYDRTGSVLLVSLVTVARSLPMLLIGAFAGVVGEAVNRKALLVGGLFMMAMNAGILSLLAAEGALRIFHVALGGAVAGTFWATEMAVRRRMIAETMPAPHVGQAVALDSLTASFSRMLGPLLGGVSFEILGVAGAYFISAILHMSAALAVLGLVFRQESRQLSLGRIPAEIAEGIAVARRHPLLLGVVCVTIVTNVFGFSYSTLIAPLGIHRYGVSPALVGLLAAAEPLGAIAIGFALSAGRLPRDPSRALVRGSLLFMAGLVATALSPWYGLAFAALLVGGLGTATFSVMQSTLVLSEAPAGLRSRVMGLITVCIGTGPLGVLTVGALSEWLGAPAALLTMATAGAIALAAIARGLRRRPPD
jgi:MFS family permease